MRAIQITEYGGAEHLKIREKVLSKPGKGQALVRIECAGINFIDIYQRRGIYPVPLPYIPGMEGSGTVEAVGEGVSHIKPGERVAYVVPIQEPGGSYAEQALINAAYLIPLPPSLSFEQGAAFPLQGMTAHYLLYEFRNIKKDDVVLIHAAAGGMGLLLVQWAKHLGARVIGTTSTEKKAAIAKEAGADAVILYGYGDQPFAPEVHRLTNGHGADLIIDGVAKSTFPGNLEAAALRGHIVIYGAASGAAAPISPNILMQRSLTVSGGLLFNYLLNRNELIFRANAVIQGIEKGWLKMHIDQVLPLDKASVAHQRLEERKSIGKILLKTS